jgi:hypothetical protein
MKIDYKFLKEILSIMEENELHLTDNIEIIEKLGLNYKIKSDFDKFIGHILILGDNFCIECDDEDYGFKGGLGGKYFLGTVPYRLTAQGYEFLTMLKQDSILSKIRDFTVPIAIEAGKSLLLKGITG